MSLYSGRDKVSRIRVGKDKIVNKMKANSFLLTVSKGDEQAARATIGTMLKGAIKYQGWDEGTWLNYRFYFYTPADQDLVKKVFKNQLKESFTLAKV